MPNPMFENRQPQSPAKGGGIFAAMFNRMYNSNPAFRDFANSMKGLSEDEMIRKCGADPAEVNRAKQDPTSFLMGKGMM